MSSSTPPSCATLGVPSSWCVESQMCRIFAVDTIVHRSLSSVPPIIQPLLISGVKVGKENKSSMMVLSLLLLTMRSGQDVWRRSYYWDSHCSLEIVGLTNWWRSLKSLGHHQGREECSSNNSTSRSSIILVLVLGVMVIVVVPGSRWIANHSLPDIIMKC